MIISKDGTVVITRFSQPKSITIDLTAPQGNGFFLIDTAKKIGRLLGMRPNEIDEMVGGIRKQISSSIYYRELTNELNNGDLLVNVQSPECEEGID